MTIQSEMNTLTAEQNNTRLDHIAEMAREIARECTSEAAFARGTAEYQIAFAAAQNAFNRAYDDQASLQLAERAAKCTA